jgi:hypothetical protein
MLLGYALSGAASIESPRYHQFARFTLAAFALSCLTALIMTLLHRYH